MLPFGARLANLYQSLDTARSALWNTIDAVNNLDKDLSDTRFKEFKQVLTSVEKETEELTREAKLYNTEFQRKDET